MSEQEEQEQKSDAAREAVSEMIGSLTGFDEIAIEKATGHTIEWMSGHDHEIQLMRAVAAVQLARAEAGPKYADAYRQAMGMKQSEVLSYFAPEPEDAMPDDPDSEVGKGNSPHVNEPTISQPSVLSPESPPISTPA